MRGYLLVIFVFACGDRGSSHATPDANLACTAEARDVAGTAVATGVTVQYEDVNNCMHRIVVSRAELDAVFGANVPAELANVDFAVDRVLLGMTNPQLRFIVDDGAQLVVGEQEVCQGIAPQCTATIVHTTRNTMVVNTCPFVGPDICP